MMAIAAEKSAPRGSLLLGLLVAWQGSFLVLSNLWGTAPPLPAEVLRYELGEEPTVSLGAGRVRESELGRGVLARAMDRWSELTGQWQGWALFAPDVPRVSAFLAIELRWHDEPARRESWRSQFEPGNPDRYWLPAWGSVRLYNYEWRLASLAGLHAEPAQSSAESAAREDVARQLLVRQWRQYQAWMRMRAADYATTHPGQRPPDEIVLLGRVYRRGAENLGSGWQAPREFPLARWRPGRLAAPGELPLEQFQAAANDFVPLSRAG